QELPASTRPPGLTTLPRVAGLTLLLPFIEAQQVYDRYDFAQNWNHVNNLTAVNTKIAIFNCPATPNPNRLDGLPEASPWVGGIGAPTDYSPTIGVEQRLATLINSGLPVGAIPAEWGEGLMPKNKKSTFADAVDGLSNTIAFGESAGRPFI